VKSIACELPSRTKQPISRLYAPDIVAELVRLGIVTSISPQTVWRWLEEDALKPWKHRMWILPRDPMFEAKSGPVLDLYERRFGGHLLADDDFVLSSDEKTSIHVSARFKLTHFRQVGIAHPAVGILERWLVTSFLGYGS
jgi:hypothetical protein